MIVRPGDALAGEGGDQVAGVLGGRAEAADVDHRAVGDVGHGRVERLEHLVDGHRSPCRIGQSRFAQAWNRCCSSPLDHPHRKRCDRRLGDTRSTCGDRLSGLRRRQPLLRGARRLHPPPRPAARAALRAVVRRSTAASTTSSAAGSAGPSSTPRSTRSPRPGRCTTTSAATRTASRRSSSCASASRSRPTTATRRPASQVMDQPGPGEDLAVPDPRRALRGAAQARHRRGHADVHRVQPLARRGLGLRTTRTASSPRRTSRCATSTGPCRELEWALDHGARVDRHAPGRAAHRARAHVAVRRVVRPVLGARRTRPASRSWSTPATAATRSQGYADDRFEADVRRRPDAAERPRLRHRAGGVRLPDHARSSRSSSSASRTCAWRRSRTARSSCRDLFRKLRSTAKKMPGWTTRGSGRDVPPARLDQPVLGGRPVRGRRAAWAPTA